MIYQFEDRTPEIGKDVFVAASADVIGSVVLAAQASVWFNAVLRGDTDLISVGERTNIQDNAVLHTDPGIQAVIGKGVTIGHCAMVHGCEIGDNSLIGINAVILNGAKIGRNCLVGANALVPEGMVIPDNSMVLGTPAKVVRQLDQKMVAVLQASSEVYVQKAASFRRSLRPLEADIG